MNTRFTLLLLTGICLFGSKTSARSFSFSGTNDEFNSLKINDLHSWNNAASPFRPVADSLKLGPNPLRICLPADPSVSTFVNFQNLILEGDLTGVWSDLDSSGALGNWPLLEFSFAKTGSWNFSYELPTGESALLEIILSANPEAEAGRDFQLDCHEKKATLGQSDAPSSWLFEWAGPASLPPVSSPVVEQAGTWFLTVTDGANGCSATDSVQVFADPGLPKIAGLHIEAPVCSDEKTGFIRVDSVFGGYPPYLQSIDYQSPGTENDFSFSTETYFQNLPGGFYQLKIQDALGCEFDSLISLPEPLRLTLFASLDTTILKGNFLKILPQTNFEIARFEWQGPAIFSENAPAQNLNPLADGVFILSAENEFGCKTSTSFSVKINPDVPVFFPNIIRQDSNNDDIFYPQGPPQNSTRISRLAVFSRTGDLVFEQKNTPFNDRQSGWNGQFRGKPVLPGVFVWLAELQFADGTRRQQTGNLTVVR